jgi:hypothetical protein
VAQKSSSAAGWKFHDNEFLAAFKRLYLTYILAYVRFGFSAAVPLKTFILQFYLFSLIKIIFFLNISKGYEPVLLVIYA